MHVSSSSARVGFCDLEDGLPDAHRLSPVVRHHHPTSTFYIGESEPESPSVSFSSVKKSAWPYLGDFRWQHFQVIPCSRPVTMVC